MNSASNSCYVPCIYDITLYIFIMLVNITLHVMRWRKMRLKVDHITFLVFYFSVICIAHKKTKNTTTSNILLKSPYKKWKISILWAIERVSKQTENRRNIFPTLFGYISKSIFPTLDSSCLIISHNNLTCTCVQYYR